MRVMKITNEFPPNYEVVRRVFPTCEEQRAVFTYGDTVYNPFNTTITKDLEVHEKTHSERQAVMGADNWWARYIEDVDFRGEEELLAYAHQYAFVKRNVNEPGLAEWLLDKCAEALSSRLYGLTMGSNEAKCKIKKRARLLPL